MSHNKRVAQSRFGSFMEATTSIGIGFVLSFIVLALIVRPMFHLDIDLTENLQITMVFTVSSVIRSYAVRRWFTTKGSAKRRQVNGQSTSHLDITRQN